ncbi:MAG: hypothetical protein ACRDPL_19175, partial [Propionibacteriaceae bacterium]
ERKGLSLAVVGCHFAGLNSQACRQLPWYASPATAVGYELIGAGMLILAGDGRGLPFDYDALERWTRVGYERGMRSRKGER